MLVPIWIPARYETPNSVSFNLINASFDILMSSKSKLINSMILNTLNLNY